MGVIQEVNAIRGFNPLMVTPENFHLVLYYAPQMLYEYRIIITMKEEELAALERRKVETHRQQRVKLMEIRADDIGYGPKKLKLTDDAVKFLAKTSTPVTDVDRAIAVKQKEIDQLWAYFASLKMAFTTALAYQGQTREETKFGFASSRLSTNFVRTDEVPVSKPLPPRYDPETGEVYEKDEEPSFNLPEIEDEDEE